MFKRPFTIQDIIDFFRIDLWRIRLETVSPRRSFLLRQLRIISLSIRGFDEDKCGLRASALTFYSLLSVVPVAAMLFGIAKGFGIQNRLEQELVGRLKGQEEVVAYIIDFAHAMLENTKGGVIAGIGLLVLFWLIIKLLGNIEKSFNEIWGIPKPRSLGRKLSDYLSIMLVCPVLLVMSSSVTVFITTQITSITQKIDLLGPISPLIIFSLKLLPYCVIWILFSFVYIFMPHTKVNFRSGLLGGVVAGTIYVILQWAYINFQIGVSRYGAIYGSFAALPLFLTWLQLSWLVVLFGAEISFAHQNVGTYEFEPDAENVSHSFKTLLALRVTHICVERFNKGEDPWSAARICSYLEAPARLVNQVLYELVKCNVLRETNNSNGDEPLFLPARNVDILSVSYVIDTLERCGNSDIHIAKSEELDKISDCLIEFSNIIDNSKSNILLKDI